MTQLLPVERELPRGIWAPRSHQLTDRSHLFSLVYAEALSGAVFPYSFEHMARRLGNTGRVYVDWSRSSWRRPSVTETCSASCCVYKLLASGFLFSSTSSSSKAQLAKMSDVSVSSSLQPDSLPHCLDNGVFLLQEPNFGSAVVRACQFVAVFDYVHELMSHVCQAQWDATFKFALPSQLRHPSDEVDPQPEPVSPTNTESTAVNTPVSQ